MVRDGGAWCGLAGLLANAYLSPSRARAHTRGLDRIGGQPYPLAMVRDGGAWCGLAACLPPRAEHFFAPRAIATCRAPVRGNVPRVDRPTYAPVRPRPVRRRGPGRASSPALHPCLGERSARRERSGGGRSAERGRARPRTRTIPTRIDPRKTLAAPYRRAAQRSRSWAAASLAAISRTFADR